MNQLLKKYGSFFLLLLFLFPLVEKQLHIYDHAADLHCNASDKHYHEMEHSCSICEFTIADSPPVPDTFLSIIIVEFPCYFQVLNELVKSSITFQDIPSRAPPHC